MALYSFVVIAQQPSGLIDPMIMLDKGLNVFTAEVSDLEVFKAQLSDEGVEVKKVNRLDDFQGTTPTDLQLPGEGPLALNGSSDGEIET
jgi:hypothetical protein